jgi:7-carboxy-7-deazaguanine synthase
MSLDEIVARVRGIGCDLVKITREEPLAHPNAFALADRLVAEGFTLLVETSGSEDISSLPPEAHVIMDLKCPGSGECGKNRWENLPHLDERDEIKFVVKDREDYEWSRGAIRERGLDRRVREGSLRALLISPVWGDEGPDLEALAGWILEDALPVRLQTQLHKHIWGPTRTGV